MKRFTICLLLATAPLLFMAQGPRKWGLQVNSDLFFTQQAQQVAPGVIGTQTKLKIGLPKLEFLMQNKRGDVHRFRLEGVQAGIAPPVLGFGTQPGGRQLHVGVGYQYDLLLGNRSGEKAVTPYLGMWGKLGTSFSNYPEFQTGSGFPETMHSVSLSAGIAPGIRWQPKEKWYLDVSLPIELAQFDAGRTAYNDFSVSKHTHFSRGNYAGLRVGVGFWSNRPLNKKKIVE